MSLHLEFNGVTHVFIGACHNPLLCCIDVLFQYFLALLSLHASLLKLISIYTCKFYSVTITG